MTSASNLDSLKKKRDIINARIRLAQNREQFKERKDNTRRKILIGSYYLIRLIKTTPMILSN